MSGLPYIYVPADGPMTPVVVSVPHAGLRIPDEDRDLIVADDRTLLRDADLYVDRLYRDAAHLGASMLAATVSRYVLDLNRSTSDVDPPTCMDWEHYGKANAKGLVWRESTDGHRVLARPLTRAELQDRIDRVHTPYHSKLRELLEERREHFGYAILLDAHSMPSVGRKGHADEGVRRADVVPGNNHGASCSPEMTDLVVAHFEESGFGVSVNEPYSGGYITRSYGQPDQGIHAIQVELNRALYLNEDIPSWAGERSSRLVRATHELVVKLTTLNLS